MLTLSELRDALGAVEPEYARLAGELGAEAIPFLRELVLSEDMRIATKAVHLAAMVGDPWCVARAVKQPNERLRMAAAAAAIELNTAPAARILGALLADPDPQVRAVAGRYVGENPRLQSWLARRSSPP